MKRSLPALCLLLAACSEREPAPTAREPLVYTTFYPTAYFAERIAGGEPKVVCPVPEGADPIFWEPSREVLAAYQSADLVVLNGAGYERWVQHASLAPSRLVDTAAPFRERFLVFETVTHSHGAAGAHTHEGIDGHTWMDPQNARIQAGEIERAFAARWPERAAAFAENLRALERDLDALDARFRELAPRLAAARLVATHPAFDYLAQRYGFAVKNLAMDPEAPLDEGELAKLRESLDATRPRILLWESAPLEATAKRLRDELELRSVVFSPCELLSSEERAAGLDYLGAMRAELDRLEAALDGC